MIDPKQQFKEKWYDKGIGTVPAIAIIIALGVIAYFLYTAFHK